MKRPWVKEDWDVLEFQRQDRDPRPPSNYLTWTYKRKPGQYLVWAIFGNDEDGVTPWAMGKSWTWWAWWKRNAMTNLRWYVIGLANWQEDMIPNPSRDMSHLEYKFWIGKNLDESNFILSWTRKKEHKVWFPFIRVPLVFGMRFWIGWKPHKGELDCSLKKK